MIKDVFNCLKNGFKELFSKKNLEKYLVYGILVLPLVLLFVGFFCVPSKASEPSQDYQDGYADGYTQGYNDGKSDILDALDVFNILEFYYDSAILFISTDNGNTFASVSGQDYIISYDSTLKCLNILKDGGAPWNANAIYYLDISFDVPLYVLNARVPSNKSPSLQRVVVGDVAYSITYGYYDDNPYFMSKDMFTNLTTDLKIYFSVPGGYISGARDFNVYLDGFVFGAEAYNNGYENGIKSLDELIENYQTNINVLKEEIENLQNAVNNQFGWRSFFFTMADVPFYTAASFLDYQIFGINLFHALIGFITLLLIFAIIRRFFR